MIKRSLILFCIFILALSFLVSAENKIELSLPKDVLAAGESLSLKVSLYDENNAPIMDNLTVTIEDAEKKIKIEKIIPSNKLISIELEETAPPGFWTVTAEWKELTATAVFSIETNEIANFEIKEDKLTIKNMGNTRYSKTIQILIGDTVGTKKIDLDVGEETSFRLIAPNGIYNVRVTDGKTVLTKDNVALSGKVIGILDEKLAKGNAPLTGGLKPGEKAVDETFYFTIKNKKFVYVFLIGIIGAGILLAIERNYRKKIS